MRFSARIAAVCLFSGLALCLPAAAQNDSAGGGKAKLYNTAKQKLLDGKQINGHTISQFDIKAYCEQAPHYDFTWFEMQHSTMTWRDIEQMIAACPRVGATPMVRIMDEFESSLQHAADIGLLGVVMPTVDTVEKAVQTVRYFKYPPEGRRSQGAGQAAKIWGVNGINYRQTVNENMLVVLMIETPTGVSNAFEIARTPGVDVVIVGTNDMTNFSGAAPTSARYQQYLTEVRDSVKRAGKLFGTADAQYRSGHPLSPDVKFTQHGPPNDDWKPPAGVR